MEEGEIWVGVKDREYNVVMYIYLMGITHHSPHTPISYTPTHLHPIHHIPHIPHTLHAPQVNMCICPPVLMVNFVFVPTLLCLKMMTRDIWIYLLR